ncbi:hypothetical protein PINS_up017625 [Pythium insidiosum]|nr:hypothetical protein PINS_up017625 [Pythium insidiosum]
MNLVVPAPTTAAHGANLQGSVVPSSVEPRPSRASLVPFALRHRRSSFESLTHSLRQQTRVQFRASLVVLVLACQLFCGSYALLLGLLYRFLDTPEMSYQANLLASPATRHLSFWGTAHILVAVLQFADVALVVSQHLMAKLGGVRWLSTTRSIRQRISRSATHSLKTLHLSSFTASSRLTWATQRSLRLASRLQRLLFGRRGLLSLDSPHFDNVFHLRELVEITAQCLQLRRYSMLLTRAWLNDIFVAVFVLDCWDTPVLELLLRRWPALQRLASLLCDVILTVLTNVVLPSVILLPIVADFDTAILGFTAARLYDDRLFISMITESQSVFALTTIDGLTKLIPHVSIFMNLRTIRDFLGLHQRRRSSQHHVVKLPSQSGQTSDETQRPRRRSRAEIATHLVRAAFFAIGAVVLSLHLSAAARSSSTAATSTRSNHNNGCVLPLRPWYVANQSCAIFQYNCYRQQRESPHADALAQLNRQALLYLIFSHCSSLEMPASIRDFPSLVGLEIYNSTLSEWSERARDRLDDAPAAQLPRPHPRAHDRAAARTAAGTSRVAA